MEKRIILALFFLCFLTSFLQAEEYTVQKGDSLYRIAKQYGTSVTELKKLNNLTSSKLKIGQVLTVSPIEKQTETTVQSGSHYQAARTFHRVRPGETLSSIAKRHNLSVEQLRRLNNLSGSLIKPGQRLLIAVSWSRQPEPTEPVIEVAEETLSETELKALASLPPEGRVNRVIENALCF
ncbi:MAG TPA: LysM peptidoglycan-binding domain-containing protein, partial [bacterium]|nr:LysM peptidoglycan-binding domain-containing protein [bacterium]